MRHDPEIVKRLPPCLSEEISFSPSQPGVIEGCWEVGFGHENVPFQLVLHDGRLVASVGLGRRGAPGTLLTTCWPHTCRAAIRWIEIQGDRLIIM